MHLVLHCRLFGIGKSQKQMEKFKKKKEKREEYVNSALGRTNNYKWPRAGRRGLGRV